MLTVNRRISNKEFRILKWKDFCPSFAIRNPSESRRLAYLFNIRYSRKIPLILAVVLIAFFLTGQVQVAGADSLQQQGIEAYEHGNFEQALDFFTQAVTQ